MKNYKPVSINLKMIIKKWYKMNKDLKEKKNQEIIKEKNCLKQLNWNIFQKKKKMKT